MPLSEVVIGFPAEPSVMKGDSVCQTITIIGDDIMEGNESFTVIMTPVNDLDDIIGSTSVTILILLDEDGKIFISLLTIATQHAWVAISPLCKKNFENGSV